MTDYRKAELDAKTLRILEYAEKLTLHPREMSEDDLASLRAEGRTEI